MNLRSRNFSLLSFLTPSFTALFLLFFGACGGTAPGSSPNQNQGPTDLQYSAGTANYIQAIAIPTNNPTSKGGAVTSYGATPPLPLGIVLNPRTGVISGAAIN